MSFEVETASAAILGEIDCKDNALGKTSFPSFRKDGERMGPSALDAGGGSLFVFTSGTGIGLRSCDAAEFAADEWPTEALLLGISLSALTAACWICKDEFDLWGSGEENKN